MVCSALGTILLIVLIVGCLPLTVPRIFGYQLYTVISGSMEPEIPVGSLVYIKGMEPEDVEEKDVIAFYGGRDSNAIITHRVVENRVVMGEFITKGDANQTEDMNPVDYNEFIGRVELSIPAVGGIAQSLTSRLLSIFADNVKYYRLEKNLSQEKLAELSGLHRTYISAVERQQRNISIDNIEAISSALNIEAYKFFIERTVDK